MLVTTNGDAASLNLLVGPDEPRPVEADRLPSSVTQLESYFGSPLRHEVYPQA
jgi:hypothetical protein